MRLPYNKELKHFARDLCWAPLLACPAVHGYSSAGYSRSLKFCRNRRALLGEPAVAPVNQSVITFENCLNSVGENLVDDCDRRQSRVRFLGVNPGKSIDPIWAFNGQLNVDF